MRIYFAYRRPGNPAAKVFFFVPQRQQEHRRNATLKAQPQRSFGFFVHSATVDFKMTQDAAAKSRNLEAEEPGVVLRDWYFKPAKADSYRIQLVGYNASTPAESPEQVEGNCDALKMETVGNYHKRLIQLFKTGFPSKWKEYLEEDCDRRQHDRSMHEKTMAALNRDVPGGSPPVIVPELPKTVGDGRVSAGATTHGSPAGVVPVHIAPQTPKPIMILTGRKAPWMEPHSVEIPYVPSRRRLPQPTPLSIPADTEPHPEEIPLAMPRAQSQAIATDSGSTTGVEPVSEEIPFVPPRSRPQRQKSSVAIPVGRNEQMQAEPVRGEIPIVRSQISHHHLNYSMPGTRINEAAVSTSRQTDDGVFAVPRVPPLRKVPQTKKRPTLVQQSSSSSSSVQQSSSSVQQSSIRNRLRHRNLDISYLEANLAAPIREQIAAIKRKPIRKAAPKPSGKKATAINTTFGATSFISARKKRAIPVVADLSFRVEFASVAKQHPLFALRSPSPTPAKKSTRQLPKAPKNRKTPKKPTAKKQSKNVKSAVTSVVKKRALPKKLAKPATTKKPAKVFEIPSTVKQPSKKATIKKPLLPSDVTAPPAPPKISVRKSSVTAKATPPKKNLKVLAQSKKVPQKKLTFESPAVRQPTRKNRTVAWFRDEVKKAVAAQPTSANKRNAVFNKVLFAGVAMPSPSHHVLPSIDWDEEEVGDFEAVTYTDTTRTFRMSAAPKRSKRKPDEFEPSNAGKASERLNWQGFQEQERVNDKKRTRLEQLADDTAATSFYGGANMHRTVMNLVQRSPGRSRGLFADLDEEDD
ncbi:hypothetical protein BV898_00988 [Hypsibius exemplaris]|uniref:SANTA domain-containing protein n=1 Tax=Hypsibius exemplaris TaxID=2072580 RepID=A0A1W0XCT8_HYPEX|nr:hypothetical protein BV898_00988 [Hypsibius exemplaris]